jgi:hypothetical protein
MRCSVHCPPGGGEVVAGAVAVAAAVGGLTLAVVAAVGTQLVLVMAGLCVLGVATFVVAVKRGSATWRPVRPPSRRVLRALEAAAAREVGGAARPAITAPAAAPTRLPVYAKITDLEDWRGRTRWTN